MENQASPAGQEQESAAAKLVKKSRGKLSLRSLRLAKNKKTVLVAIVILAILGGLFFTKELFVAATVNGTPVSRLSVIRELEKSSGQQALDTLVTKKLITTETTKRGIHISDEEINTEIQDVEAQIQAQGISLKDALAQQGMTEEQFREQVELQKKIEAVLADKIQVSDEEVEQSFTQNKAALPPETSEADFKNQIREQIKSQKFNMEASQWIEEIKSNATIRYFVDYGQPPLPDPLPEAPQGE